MGNNPESQEGLKRKGDLGGVSRLGVCMAPESQEGLKLSTERGGVKYGPPLPGAA